LIKYIKIIDITKNGLSQNINDDLQKVLDYHSGQDASCELRKEADFPYGLQKCLWKDSRQSQEGKG
jgi:hypothetical protein